MSDTKYTFLLRMRLFAIILGLVLLIWFSIEDSSTFIVILLSLFFCAWVTSYFLIRKKRLKTLPNYYFILIGLLAGSTVTPIAIFLMIFKTGLHAHPTPDFTEQQFISVIYRTPLWLIGGMLMGFGLGIWLKS